MHAPVHPAITPPAGPGPIVVGVTAARATALAAAAIPFARAFGRELVCATVDPGRYPVGADADGVVIAAPLDADGGEETRVEMDPKIVDLIARILHGSGVRWSLRALAGGPAQELARLADRLDAPMIIVGTRDGGLGESLRELLGGSVAAQLAHGQHRPVVVIPRAARRDESTPTAEMDA